MKPSEKIKDGSVLSGVFRASACKSGTKRSSVFNVVTCPRCSQIHKGFHASPFSGPESVLSVVNILDDPAVQCLERMLRVKARLETVPVAGDVDDYVFKQVAGVARATATGLRVVSGGAQPALANAGESKETLACLRYLSLRGWFPPQVVTK